MNAGRAAILVFVLIGVSLVGAHAVPSDDVLNEIGFTQRLGEQVPGDLSFLDETGARVSMEEMTRERPVLLVPVYYECPMLCNLTLNGLLRTLRAVRLTVGKDFDVLVFSIDPTEGVDLARAKKATYVKAYGRPGSEKGWRFLTGQEDEIQRLTKSIGFRYVKDPNRSEYAHAAGFAVLTPDRKVARYFLGAEYPPKDVRLSLVDASGGRIGTPVDQFLLYCYHYDPSEGRYTLAVMKLVRGAGAGTALLLASAVGLMIRRERKRSPHRPGE